MTPKNPKLAARPRRSLLDVNVLIALVDPAHVDHARAHAWFAPIEAWATCPITENGFVRVLSSPAYPGLRLRPVEAAELLRELIAVKDHAFLPDRLSLLDSRFRLEGVAPAQLTDVYLLGLATDAGARLVTIDTRVPAAAVEGGAGALEVVG